MKRYYCTYFDRNYLTRALALIASLYKHDKNDFQLFAVCMDELTRLILNRLNLPNVTAIPMHEIEQRDFPLLAAKKDRSLVEYYWTATPSIILRLLEKNPHINVLTYIDADLFFFSSPNPIYEEFGNSSILIHEHRFPPRLIHFEQFGRYNVGLLCFRNDKKGLKALHWWRERCIEWCFNRPENGKFADQLYLNDWTSRFEGVSVLENIGAGAAPWNHEQYTFTGNDSGAISVNESPLIFYHFHALVLPVPEIIVPTKHLIYNFTEDILRLCVVPYARALSEALTTVQTIFSDFSFGSNQNEELSLNHTFLIKKHYVINNETLSKALVCLEGDWNYYAPAETAALDDAVNEISSLSSAGHMEEAHLAATGALERFPDSPDLINLLSRLKFQMGKFEEAKSILTGLINRFPKYSPALTNLGFIFWQEGNIENALQYFSEALNVNPSDREAILNCGELLMTLKRFGEAENLLMSYLQFSRDEEISFLLEEVKKAEEEARKISYHKPILGEEEGNELIKTSIAGSSPMMISRLGAVELSCISFYIVERQDRTNKKAYPENIRFPMSNNAGVFPVSDKLLDDFSELYLRCIEDIDILGVWFNDYEDIICNSYCKNAHLVPLRSLEPYYHKKPWSIHLKGYNILVIHPFAETIYSQYNTFRKKLFENPDILPLFNLKSVKAIQSIAGSKTVFSDWFEALSYMCKEIDKVDFDIAIIGAGAYGLPLASYIKSSGKKAVHMGGATQILFGIKGKRWDEHEVISKLYNPFWARPSDSETPEGSINVENGCYW
jgi:tetratricopeptide (TPR) repeat protein